VIYQHIPVSGQYEVFDLKPSERKFRDSVESRTWRKERRHANDFRRKRGVPGQIVFIGVAQEKPKAFSGSKIKAQFQCHRNKRYTSTVNPYYLYGDFGPLFVKLCSYALCEANGASTTTVSALDLLRSQ
jgi:hypothetical protein